MGIKEFFAAVMSFIMMVTSLPAALTGTPDSRIDFTVTAGEEAVLLTDESNKLVTAADDLCAESWFNFFGIAYKSDDYVRGTVTYKKLSGTHTEEFFLEPSDEISTFYSFIDEAADGKRYYEITSLTFEPLTEEKVNFSLYGIKTFNRKKPDGMLYISNEKAKIGVDLTAGGALSYFEDLDSDVEVVKSDGRVYVDSDASSLYGTIALNRHVNLINCSDRGRLVQQSYYGTKGGSDGYETGDYTYGSGWNYNPVQGGNQYNDASKIVDYRVTGNTIYIKCRPMDWAKDASCISPSYMEATLTLDGGVLHTECRFVDFSGYTPTYATQELPAFYCIEPLNDFVYYSNGEEICDPGLIFWPDAGYPTVTADENWIAFRGDNKDSFGIGLYTPGRSTVLAGIYNREGTETRNPSTESATSYAAVEENIEFRSFSPFTYDYYITTGTTDEIRSAFNSLGQ